MAQDRRPPLATATARGHPGGRVAAPSSRVDAFEQFVLTLPNTALIAPSCAVARNAARLRARYGIRAPDALVVATARVEGAQAVVTNDAGLRKLKPEGIAIVVLDDYV